MDAAGSRSIGLSVSQRPGRRRHVGDHYQRRQRRLLRAVATLELAFTLDGEGRVWQWSNGRCALGMLGVALITFVAAGLVYLLLTSLLAIVWLRRREHAGR